jgi:Carboxypeptidase regulatory-like domain
MRGVVKTLVLLTLLVLLPSFAFAQASITGVVKDASGGVLPGVSVEAASPALIEKVRTAVTDGTGQYRIEDLRPGTYTITISLTGFSTYKREGIEMSGTFTATINADLKVGSLSETITVSGETPVVDVQSASREISLSTDVVKSIPTVRSYNGIVVIVPGVVTNLNDTVTGTATTQFPIHGGRNNEGRLTIDGLNIGNPPGGNQPPAYIADVGNAQEVTFITSGGLGETETAGLTMNIVPRTGGNRMTGSLFFSGTGSNFQSNNLTSDLIAQGVAQPTPLEKVYDLNGAIGGPIKQDKIWYYINARTQGSTKKIAGIYANANAGDAAKWLYVADPSNQMYSDRTWENISGRVTWQVTPRNKFGAFWDEQATCRKCTGATTGITDPARVTPEATGVGATKPLRVPQATWTSPVTSRLLLDAGFGGVYYGWGNMERDPNPTANLVRVSEQCAAGCPANGGIPGLVYRSQDFGTNFTGSWNWKGNVSYVTGAHSFKVGYQGTYMTDDRTWSSNTQNMTFRLNNGVPNQLTESISPWINNARAGWYAFFVQDQYTRGRVTLQGALRFDRSSSWFPQQQEGPSRFLPTPIIFPETDGVNAYKDFTPRLGASWDVFGNGRTAIKANLGKYLEGVGVQLNYANSNPSLRMPQTTSVFGTAGVTRTWTDGNNNFVPDCNLLNPNANSAGGDTCGAISNLLFGQNVLTNNYDPALLTGMGVRSADWDLGVTLQQQLMPRASLEVAYTRRWYSGFTVTDNQATANSDWSPYSITAPSDPRLPGGGGYTVSGLYDVNPAKFGQVNNLIIDSSKYGEEYQYFNGLDLTLNIRLRNGLTLTGGTSTGQTVADNCAVRANLPELNQGIGAGLVGSTVNTVSPYCHVAYGILTQGRGLGSYIVPKIEVQVSGVFQSKPGQLLAANYAAPNSAIIPSLGRPLAGNAPNATINLLAPGSMYGDRVNQLDFRVAKILKFGRSRLMAGVDLYNALNSSAVLTYNAGFVPNGTWLTPITFLTGRLLKFSAEITF